MDKKFNLEIDSEKNEENGFIVENLNEAQKGIPPELEKKIKTKIRQMSNGVFSEEELLEIYDNISKKGILENQKNGNLEKYLNNEIKRNIIEKLHIRNKENDYEQEEKLYYEVEKKEEVEGNEEQLKDEINEEKEEEKEVVIEHEKEDKNDVPEDVKKACEKLGINKIRGYFYVNANDLNRKVDNTLVNKNGNRVLMLEVPTEKIEGPNKYYGMQDDRMVVYGNEDEAVREVTGNVTKMGKIVEPLKLQEPKAVEYSDDNGLVVNERIDDNLELSVQEANNYREEMIELLEKYSQNIEIIKNTDTEDLVQKEELLNSAYVECVKQSDEIAQKYDISIDDVENINEKIEEENIEDKKEEAEEAIELENEKEDDEPDYFEVPGKRTH